MGDFGFSSYKYEEDQKLLSALTHSIFVLKVAAQDKVVEFALAQRDVEIERKNLLHFLHDLTVAVQAVMSEQPNADIADLSFVGIADRFIKFNDTDVADRLIEVTRLEEKLVSNTALSVREFQLLDQLQSLLEAETTEAIQSLYRF